MTTAVKKLQKVTDEELDGLRKAGAETHADRIAELEQQSEILASLLPAQLSGADLEAAIDRIVSEGSLTQKRDMGRIMGALTKETDGNFDKPAAAAYAGSKLS
jgi:uncharacterized protein YqeY